ncbi:carcinoembryonic antigen-related cell adhesion molecule 5-like [Mugil cephalus]|uniref:carcinoembryonic antigen-related cell adhesion molecule 5-like n=1 Tax=Mugil cephalus TaxID=48193 RepID=UPI001FB7DCDB|nr:carcinoembryonic antigen-related cell adhesion molecule 5-like [Mugil cephalus]
MVTGEGKVSSGCTMVHHSAGLLPLLLICLAGFSASETEQGGIRADTPYGPFALVIDGVSVVTVGIPYGFNCFAECDPSCRFTWTRGNVTSEGSQLSLTLLHVEPTQTLTCTAVNPATGRSASAEKTLQVAAGPENIQISGPPMLTYGAASDFTCSADCYPSCTYSWTVILEEEVFSTAQGKTISVSPPASGIVSETLICEAQNAVSQLFISTVLNLWVASLSDVSIAGDSTVTLGQKYIFTCSALCVPPCIFTWKYMGRTFKGQQIQLPILTEGNSTKYENQLEITFREYSKNEPLICEATNAASHVTSTAIMDLTVINPISVRPVSQTPPVEGHPFILQCVGTQNPASILWLKNNQLLTASKTVIFSPDNITLYFPHVLPTDVGLYKCVVIEGVAPIQAVGYQLQINYGPEKVAIVEPNKGPLGDVTFALPGSMTVLQCLAGCFPVCSIAWFYNGTLLSRNTSILFTPITSSYKATLTCEAFSAATQKTETAKTTVIVPDGPKNVVISGPDSLQVGVTTTFKCTAECTPPCFITWNVYGKNVTSPTIDITASRQVASESISCHAENGVSGKTVTVRKTLSVYGQWCGC